MVYVDTSVVVALLTLEPSTEAVTTWFSELEEPLVSSDWLAAEFSSALSIKVRKRFIPDKSRNPHPLTKRYPFEESLHFLPDFDSRL